MQNEKTVGYLIIWVNNNRLKKAPEVSRYSAQRKLAKKVRKKIKSNRTKILARK